MPKGIPLTYAEQTARRREIFAAILDLILEKGFQETSMREIAEAARMAKSSLYDYFKNKDEIILFVLQEHFLQLVNQGQEISRLRIPPEERLRRLMEMHLAFMQANRNLHSRLVFEAQRLNPESQKQINKMRYAYQDMVADVIREGISQGCFRSVNPRNAARLLINTLVTVLYTTRPTGTAEEMLDEAVTIFLRGIKL